jgi:hypothetical protein
MYLAILCSPFPSHLGQMAWAIPRLVERGHRLELWGGRQTAQTAADLGVGYRPVQESGDIVEQAAAGHPRIQDYYLRCAFPLVVQQLPQVLRWCRKDPPDLLHSNSRVYTAAVASRLTGIPATNHCCSGLSFGLVPEDLFGFCPSGQEAPRKREVMLAMSRSFFRQMDDVFEEMVAKPWGLPRIDNAIGLTSGRAVLALTCAALSNPRLAALPYVHLVGPLVPPAAPVPAHPRPYAYVSLGTWPLPLQETLSLYRAVIAAIPNRYHVVAGLGGRFAPRDLACEDPRLAAYRYAPQTSLIHGAEFVVCHGGCQTVHEALFFGKPLIVIPPNLAEPRELSWQAHRACAAVVLAPEERDVRCIRSAIEDLVREPRYARAAESLSRALRGSGGVDRCIGILEKIACG